MAKRAKAPRVKATGAFFQNPSQHVVQHTTYGSSGSQTVDNVVVDNPKPCKRPRPQVLDADNKEAAHDDNDDGDTCATNLEPPDTTEGTKKQVSYPSCGALCC